MERTAVTGVATIAERRRVAILVDDLVHWHLATNQPTGIQRVVLELLDTAPGREDLDVSIVSSLASRTADGAPQLREVPRSSLTMGVAPPSTPRQSALKTIGRFVRRVPLPRGFRRQLKAAYLERVLGHYLAEPVADAEVVVVPGAFWVSDMDETARRLSAAGRSVRVMIYDLIPMQHPDWVSPYLRDAFAAGLETMISSADRIVSLGDAAATQLLAHYPEAGPKVRVAVPTLRAHAPRIAPEDPGIDEPYLLAVGTVEPRKNHRTILDAWRLARERLGTGVLVVAGRRWEPDYMEDELAADATVRRIDSPSDAMLEGLYQGAVATVHASRAEGFGLPARESVARGVPALMSSAIPRDGLTDGVHIFEPDDVRELTALMERAILNPEPRRLVDLGAGTGWEPVLAALVD